jgi:hypothetical protein
VSGHRAEVLPVRAFIAEAETRTESIESTMLATTEIRRYQCALCDGRYLSRSALRDHLKEIHTGPESPLWNSTLTFRDRHVCGNCGKESSPDGLKRHMVDKRDRDHPFSSVEEVCQLDVHPLGDYIAAETTEVRCEICGRIEGCRSARRSGGLRGIRTRLYRSRCQSVQFRPVQ